MHINFWFSIISSNNGINERYYEVLQKYFDTKHTLQLQHNTSLYAVIPSPIAL